VIRFDSIIILLCPRKVFIDLEWQFNWICRYRYACSIWRAACMMWLSLKHGLICSVAISYCVNNMLT